MDYKNYNWYPGHMKKAYDEIKNKISQCDAIFMMIDVRSYRSAFNEWLLNAIRLKQKQPVVILTRKDLIPQHYDLDNLENYFTSLKLPYYLLDLKTGKLDDLLSPIRITKKKINERYKGKTDFKPIIMIIGMPNSGKSTYINALKKRASAKTANIPGITKRVSLFAIKNLAMILDTPGVLIPNKLDEERAFPLHLIRAIKKDIIPINESIVWGLEKIYIHSKRQYNFLAIKYNFSEQIIPSANSIEKEIGSINLQKLYMHLSKEFSFIWDW